MAIAHRTPRNARESPCRHDLTQPRDEVARRMFRSRHSATAVTPPGGQRSGVILLAIPACVAATLTVRVVDRVLLFPEGFRVEGLKLQVAFAGRPEQLNAILAA
jgi:hypothetical protein